MRVISGRLRGKRLEMLKEDAVRPTTDKVKESIFNVIQFDVVGASFLDLFAGSGQIGIEALSRGTQKVTFVDESKRAIDVVTVTISRRSNNYGPYHFPEKLIPLMIANCLNDKALPVYGKGENVRDWLYVEDHCRAIDMIIHNGRVGEVYNIGGHNERTNLQVVKTIIQALGKSEDLIHYVTDRPGHDMRYAIDPTKIKNELGWVPETLFDEGIQKTIKWYLENKEWWENILSGEYQKYYEKLYDRR